MIEDIELETLINDIYEYYGFDFGSYSKASLKRRVNRVYQLGEFENFYEFLSKVRSDSDYYRSMIDEITVNVTEMFRDPSFYAVVRKEILPILATKPFIRLWHAGCSTGEEVYSMAIILKEAGLLHKSLLYATDVNATVIESAKKGIFPLRMMKEYSENYRDAGGQEDFSSYYIANYGIAKFNAELASKMVFSQHNLVSDNSFNEFDMILCRNVLIYFDTDLQKRVINLFDESLSILGFLALGTKETIKYSISQTKYKQLGQEKIWRKVK
ncbi:protein-glutamate O-methyltransferase CheR [Flavobacterium sp. Fl-77]|uniref:Protein-glutamate O-methyltransferase CheR n=1 Tax=Flavobacterium flavipigmentatum TaxID=2893884 RepID=A0AAJ2SJV4_9FLAO|nr:MULTISPECIES: protein-glutamate O-methyltransferase CheR [unclassified Flavobacterium]MDX6183910.1 protein-glutamate O-methyltransferase CheR [Flavobacterium sp. Fl-33]MDX6187524.1 protein-glutamate O-methyltransferase CheR [Flavobacterium sp. Fl-77]UFH37638.1 protein-glutamate O-methyltransferase CheR [Flavobacterium sp. F-70]